MARFKSLLLVIGGCTVLTAGIGCGSGTQAARHSHLTYDKTRDEFGHLRVYCDIRVARESAEEKKKLSAELLKQKRDDRIAYLGALWKNREDLIAIPVWDARSEMQILVTGTQEVKSINVESKGDEPKPEKLTIPLDQILIRPGEFFASGEGTLCCYQRCYIPGKLVDRGLDELKGHLNDSVLAYAIEIQKARREKPTERPKWADLRKALNNPKSFWQDLFNGNLGSLEGYLDDESIRLLIHQASGSQFAVTRSSERFAFRFKLSKADSAEAFATWKAFLTRAPALLLAAHELLASGPVEQEESKLRMFHEWGTHVIGVLKQAELNADEAGVLTISVDITSLLPKKPITEAVVSEGKAFSREDLAAVKALGIPVSNSVTYEKILLDFYKGRSE